MRVNIKTLSAEQLDGVSWLSERPRAILADDVGFGKTTQVLHSLLNVSAKQVLYVTGAQPSYQVREEVAEWDLPYTCRVVRGTKSLRYRHYSDLSDITVLSYETFRNDVSVLTSIAWDAVVLDDASKFKNALSKLSIAAHNVSRLLSVRYAWAVTATPYETALEDVWSIFHALNSYPFGTFEEFSDSFCVYDWKFFRGRRVWSVVRYKNLDNFKEIADQYILRRVNKSGPTLEILDHYMGMHSEQLTLYNASRSGMLGDSIHDRFTKALMFCDSTVFLKDASLMSSKLDLVISLLMLNDEKFVIYSMWKPVLRHLKELFVAKNIEFVEISGDVSIERRTENQRVFREKSSVQVCLITKCGEQALNLQSARYLICINRLANPKRMEQVHGRIKRTGSPFDKVYILNFIIEGSIEEGMIKLSDSREAISNQVLGDTSPSRFTVADKFSLLYNSNTSKVRLADGSYSETLPFVDLGEDKGQHGK